MTDRPTQREIENAISHEGYTDHCRIDAIERVCNGATIRKVYLQIALRWLYKQYKAVVELAARNEERKPILKSEEFSDCGTGERNIHVFLICPVCGNPVTPTGSDDADFIPEDIQNFCDCCGTRMDKSDWPDED